MKNATKARQEAVQILSQRKNTEIQAVETLVNQRIAEGNFEAWFFAPLSVETLETLSDLDYVVKRESDYDNSISYKISWK